MLRIGILTSGGDCQALNAAHNAAVPETETAETEEEPKKDE